MAQTYTKISALSKGLAILNIIGSSPVPIMARDIADQAGVTYSTAMNNIITLEDAGFIEKQGSGYIGSFKLASIWTNRMSYLKRRKQVISDEIEVLERGGAQWAIRKYLAWLLYMCLFYLLAGQHFGGSYE